MLCGRRSKVRIKDKYHLFGPGKAKPNILYINDKTSRIVKRFWRALTVMGTPCALSLQPSHSYPICWIVGARRGIGMPISLTFVAACLIGAALASAPALADDGRRPDKVSFYFAAHEDDWQLFMNPSAFQDVINGAAKTVFVHLTAGDAGLGVGLGGRKNPFYLARENGAEAAIRFHGRHRCGTRRAHRTSNVFQRAYDLPRQLPKYCGLFPARAGRSLVW